MWEICVEDDFSSAHQLIGYEGKCENLHGHNWRVVLCVNCSKTNEIGIGVDFKELKVILKEILAILDHKILNEVDFFKEGHNPSAENIAYYIFKRAEEILRNKNFKNSSVKSVTVYETPISYVKYEEK